MKKRILFVFIILLVMAVGVKADILILKNGEKVECDSIVETANSYLVEMYGGTVKFNKSEVKSISSAQNTIDKAATEETANRGKPPEAFHTDGKDKVKKNKSDDFWEMTIEGIMPMYEDPDPERGKSQKEMDETVLKLAIEQEGSREAAVSKIVESAWKYFNSGYSNIAMRKFNQAWSLDPKNAEVHFGFGCILTSREEPNGAIKMYTKAVDLNPKYYDAYANRGLDYCNKKAYDKAILDFTKAIEIRPNEAQTYNDRAVAYFFKGRYNESKTDVAKAQSLGYMVNPGFLAALKKASE